jgi:hypothetical protein
VIVKVLLASLRDSGQALLQNLLFVLVSGSPLRRLGFPVQPLDDVVGLFE